MESYDRDDSAGVIHELCCKLRDNLKCLKQLRKDHAKCISTFRCTMDDLEDRVDELRSMVMEHELRLDIQSSEVAKLSEELEKLK